MIPARRTDEHLQPRLRRTITYRNDDAPTVEQFEEVAELHDIVEMWADWNEIEQIVITLNVSSATPRREEIESGPTL
jgi:hypothetical protein